jgi:CDP-glucose 4,6-dehydratase
MDKVVKEYLSEFYRGRKVLITGHTGFKGSWLCMYLNHLGAEVYGYSLDPPTDPNLYSLCSIDSFVKSCIADIRIPDTLIKIIDSEKPDVIFHMAAQALVRKSYVEPVATYMTNVTGTINLLEALRVSKASKPRVLVNVTTDKCYENDGRAEPFSETDAMGGHDPYSASKGCAELVTSAYARSFFETSRCTVASGRAGNVIGGGDWAVDRIVPDLARAAERGATAVIRRPGAVRPWQHVLEPLGGYLLLGHRAATEGHRFSGAWNFGPSEDETVPVRELVEQLRRRWPELKVDYQSEQTGPHEAAVLRLDCTKARNELGWRPALGLSRAIDLTAEWYREAAKGSPVEVTDQQIAAYEHLLTEQEEHCQ